MKKWLAFCGCLAFGANAGAANIKYPHDISCHPVQEEAILATSKYDGHKKPEEIQSKYATWVLGAPGDTQSFEVDFEWRPAKKFPVRLMVIRNGFDRNRVTLVSSTNHSLIGVSTSSDQLTARSWLFTFNFRNEVVIGTKMQTNIAGVKGSVVHFSCDFNEKVPTLTLPKSTSNGVG
ncbi:hypothetical protein N9K16_02090 [Alphaproteobacteria bacterium]|nr:hypothetical protein [Alphaproteobacteria bacterium]